MEGRRPDLIRVRRPRSRRPLPDDRTNAGRNLIACRHYAWRLFRRDGVYYADGRGNAPNLGKHSLAARDRDEALANLRRLDHAKAVETGKAEPDEPAPASRTPIADGWRSFLDHCGRAGVLGGVSPETLKRYRAIRDHHLAFCAAHGTATWGAFGKPQFQAYGNARGKTAADRTLYVELTTIKGAIDFLIDAGSLPAACRFRYKLAKPQGTDRYCFRPEEVRAMLAHCAATPGRAWLGLVILALAHTGMRIGELAGLRWGDVDAGLDAISIADERASRRKRAAGTARTTKGKRSRSVPVHPRLRDALAALDRSAGGPVFRAPQGGRLRPRNALSQFIGNVIEPLSERFPTPAGEIGFGHGRLHSFRHFFISQALLNGTSEGEVREWVGHADSKLVEHYRKLHAEDARRRMQSLDLLGRDAAAGPADAGAADAARSDPAGEDEDGGDSDDEDRHVA